MRPVLGRLQRVGIRRDGITLVVTAHLSVKWGIMTASSVRVPIVD